MTTSKEKELVDEVFALTGRKLDLDDPVVVAAIFQSELFKSTVDACTNNIKIAAKDAATEIIDSVKVERNAAAMQDEKAAQIYKNIQDLGRSVSDVEANRLKSDFRSVASTILQDVARESKVGAPNALKLRLAFVQTLLMSFVLVVGIGAGLGYQNFFGKESVVAAPIRIALTSEQEMQIQAGKDFIRIIPKLTDEQKNNLISLIQQNK